jgi:hypothetical protein
MVMKIELTQKEVKQIILRDIEDRFGGSWEVYVEGSSGLIRICLEQKEFVSKIENALATSLLDQ